MDGAMEATTPTPPAASTITTSSGPTQTPSPATVRLLELNLISAQDLSPVSKSMRTYAVTWLQPNRKQTTRVDQQGNMNPTWNEKFVFRVDDEFLHAEDAAVNVEIYTVSWFRDVLVGTVRVLISNLITPQQLHSGDTRYVALQVRRSSGSPQGILNMGVSLVDCTRKSMSMPLSADQTRPQSISGYGEELEKKKLHRLSLQEKRGNNDDELHARINHWRALSLGTDINDEETLMKPGSVCNGSMVNGSVCNGSVVNGSELCSDIGPSASIVAAEMALKSHPAAAAATPPTKALRPPTEAGESESCILEDLTAEEAAAKGLTKNSAGGRKESGRGRQRRNSDGSLFSCYAYGFQFTIVCGANSAPKPVKKKGRKKTSSEANSA